MASQLAVTLIRFGFLALLWVFIFFALAVMKRDVFGTVVTYRGKGRKKSPRTESASPSETSRTASQPVNKLVITGGNLSGTTMPLGVAPIIIGRSPSSTLVLNDSYASSQHARLFPQDGTWWVEDLRSTNGTFVDGERINSPRPLGIGIQVRIGETTLELAR